MHAALGTPLFATLLLAWFGTAAFGATGKPILVSAPNSTRAIAVEAVSGTSEPFASQSSSFIYGVDRNTRIVLFALNLSLSNDNDAAAMSASAEDASHRRYDLRVEYLARIQSLPWLSMIVVRLDDAMGDLGDVLVQTSYRGVPGNRVRIGIGHIGGGPPDDSGAAPTPTPPYVLKGQVMLGNAPFAGVRLTLSQATSDSVTDVDGRYSFTVPAVGNYTLIPNCRYFTFSPTAIQLNDLASTQTINFTAVRDTFAITGPVRDDQGSGVDGVSLRLEREGAPPKFVVTTDGGSFRFADVLAGYVYTVTPQNTALWAFSAQTVAELDRNVQLSFSGTLRKYAIGGSVVDKWQHAAAGVAVVLSGASSATAITDANGSYSFPNLLAGRNYTVTASKTDHFVTPTPRTLDLLRDERVDFNAIRYYIINGRVTEGDRGLFGINMTLSGPEQVSGRTANDGSYSLITTTPGDYKLTPSREQNFYQFSPAQPDLTVNDHMTLNFTGALALTSPTYVLEFDGTQKTVDYGFFWPQDKNVGHFFWEFWAMPGNNTSPRYLLSDGYGGAHALLFGFNSGVSGHYSLFGNIWSGDPTFYFNSDDGPSPGEWGHYAVGWDGESVITYYDGVPVGKQHFTGPRSSTGWYNGSNMLLIGGSDHQNLIGRIAQVRGYEENNPLETSPEAAFRPETVFSVDGQLLSYYFTPAPLAADLSYGYNKIQHNGRPRGFFGFYYDECSGCPTPQFVIDPTAPNFADPINPGHTHTLVVSPPATPNGARVFDSFSRENSTYILNGRAGLGVTEVGGQTWRTNFGASQAQPFGILSGKAVVLANQTSLAWVTVPGEPSMEIRVDRSRGKFGSGNNTGLCFRVADKDDFFFVSSRDDTAGFAGRNNLIVGYYEAGLATLLASDIALPPDWTTLRVVTRKTGTFEVYAGEILVYSTASLQNATATGAGLFSFGSGMSLQNRWDNFTVFNAP